MTGSDTKKVYTLRLDYCSHSVICQGIRVVYLHILCDTSKSMQTVVLSDTCDSTATRSVITIGNFDGVHRGHQELFRRLKEAAAAQHARSVVVTFDPHPLRVLRPEDRRFQLITTLTQKQELINRLAVDLLVVIPFTKEFARQSAEDFVRSVLVEKLGACHLIIGHDYVFGRDRRGDYELLQKLGAELGFTVSAIDQVGERELVFSSTLVRELVSNGHIEEASHILGRYHQVSGQVVPGRQIGRSLGFPTANIAPENELTPGDGVYAVFVRTRNGSRFQGACSIGSNPTFQGSHRSIEVFLLDHDEDLYGQQVRIDFVARLRDMRSFATPEALMAQISHDVETTRRILAASDGAGVCGE